MFVVEFFDDGIELVEVNSGELSLVSFHLNVFFDGDPVGVGFVESDFGHELVPSGAGHVVQAGVEAVFVGLEGIGGSEFIDFDFEDISFSALLGIAVVKSSKSEKSDDCRSRYSNLFHFVVSTST